MNIIDRARELRRMIERNSSAMTDEEALNHSELLPKWSGEGKEYTTGERVVYDGTVYAVLQDHTSQQLWTPMDAPSLFAEVLIPDENVIPEWVQPDSTNGYKTGDKVLYDGSVYVSLIDDNIWSPADYPAGWEAAE